jgi:glucosaminylphosphatidylinositol acyltransferase
MRQPPTYKERKEAFVSNLNGGTVIEVVLVTLVLPNAVLVWSVLQSRLRYFTPYTLFPATTDFLINCCTILFATTVYANAPVILNLLLLLPAISIYATTPAPKSQASKTSISNGKTKSAAPGSVSRRQEKVTEGTSGEEEAVDPFPLKPFVTHYRGAMMTITCAAILAVDFPIFPRRFAKVENWGTSLMDMGVGSFVFSAGVVAARPILKDRAVGSAKRMSAWKKLAVSFRHAIPLLVLGLIRLYSVKGLDYAEHVTEYGVHWNFFFTLGLLPPFVALLSSFLSLLPSSLPTYPFLAILIAVLYQITLESTDLKAFILTAPRVDLFSQNREGIFSFLGYLSIFLAGQGTGLYVLPRQASIPSKSSLVQRFRTSVLGRLTVWTMVWSILYVLTTHHALPSNLSVSRRLANLPYVLWVASYNAFQLLCCAAVESTLFPFLYTDTASTITPSRANEEKVRLKEATSTLLRSYNRNGLAVFLVANLGTGLVNMTVNTLDASTTVSMGILVGYIGIVSAVAVGLDWLDISVKL